MMINSGVSEEEVLNFFENISLQTNENAPNASKQSQKGVEDLLGQPSGKFDYKVFYTKPPSFDVPIESIIPEGQGDEFEDHEPVSEEGKRVENSEQPQKEVKGMSSDMILEGIMPADSFEKQLDKKETCMVEEVIQEVTEEIQDQLLLHEGELS